MVLSYTQGQSQHSPKLLSEWESSLSHCGHHFYYLINVYAHTLSPHVQHLLGLAHHLYFQLVGISQRCYPQLSLAELKIPQTGLNLSHYPEDIDLMNLSLILYQLNALIEEGSNGAILPHLDDLGATFFIQINWQIKNLQAILEGLSAVKG